MNYKEQLSEKQKLQVQEIALALPSFAMKYFKHLESLGKSEATVLHYAYDIQMYFEYLEKTPGFKNTNLKTKTAQDIFGSMKSEDFDDYILTFTDKPLKKNQSQPEKYSVTYKNSLRVSLKAFLSYLYSQGDLDEDISRFIGLSKTSDKPAKALNKDEVAKILEAVFDTENLTGRPLENKEKTIKRDYALMMLLFGTGIRIAELAGIDISDIDFYDASIDVGRKGSDAKTKMPVYFGPEVEDALKDYIENGRPALLAGKKNDALFISLQHKRMSIRSIQDMTKAYGEKAGINHKTNPHAFRKTYGTTLYQATGDIYLVANALNHSSVDTTARHYIEKSSEDRRKAAMKASEIFKND